MWQILNLIDHDIVNLRTFVPSDSNVIQDIVNGVYNIITSSLYFPSFILAESFINVSFLVDSEENVGRIIEVNILWKVLPRELVS